MKAEVKGNEKFAKAISRLRAERKEVVARCKAAGDFEAENWLLSVEYIDLAAAVEDAELFAERKKRRERYLLPVPMDDVADGYRMTEGGNFDEDSFQEGFYSSVLTFWRANIENIDRPQQH